MPFFFEVSQNLIERTNSNLGFLGVIFTHGCIPDALNTLPLLSTLFLISTKVYSPRSNCIFSYSRYFQFCYLLF